MKNKSSNKSKLFELISTLDRREKGYINKSLKNNKKDSNLFKLFEYLSKASFYNIKNILLHFKQEAFINNLAVTQKMLYDHILKNMRTYHSKKNIYRNIIGDLQDIEFLYDKGLLLDCEKHIDKSLKISLEHELYSLSLELLNWKRNIISISYFSQDALEKIDELINLSNNIIEKHQRLFEAHNFLIELNTSYFHKIWKEDIYTFEEYINIKREKLNVLFQKKDKSLLVSLFLNTAHSKIQFHDGNPPKALETLEKIPLQYEQTSWNSLNVFARNELTKIGIKLGLNQIENLDEELSILEKLHKKHTFLQSNNNIDKIILIYKIQYCYLSGKISNDKTLEKIKKITQSKEFESLPISSWVCFHLSRYFFTVGEYNSSLIWNLKALGNITKTNKNFNYISRFHLAMIYLELQQYNKLKICIRDLQRYLKRKNRLFSYEIALLKLFKKAQTTWKKDFVDDILNEFRDIIFEHNEEIHKTFRYLELNIWIEAKNQRKTIIEYKKSLKTYLKAIQ